MLHNPPRINCNTGNHNVTFTQIAWSKPEPKPYSPNNPQPAPQNDPWSLELRRRLEAVQLERLWVGSEGLRDVFSSNWDSQPIVLDAFEWNYDQIRGYLYFQPLARTHLQHEACCRMKCPTGTSYSFLGSYSWGLCKQTEKLQLFYTVRIHIYKNIISVQHKKKSVSRAIGSTSGR